MAIDAPVEGELDWAGKLNAVLGQLDQRETVADSSARATAAFDAAKAYVDQEVSQIDLGDNIIAAHIAGQTLVLEQRNGTQLNVGDIKGDPGAPSTVAGPAGASAYEQALTAGFVGTEAEWIASLKGAKGDVGDVGATGQGLAIKGSVATAASLPATAAEGDGYLTDDDGHLHVWITSAFVDVGSVRGPAGTNGIDGKTAYEIAVAAGFVGTESAWLTSLTGAQGTQGIQGVQGIQGTAGPIGMTWRGTWDNAIDYVDNDAVFYANSSWFAAGDPDIAEEPTLSATHWQPLAIQGAQGVQGVQGVPGTTTWAGLTDVPSTFAPSAHTHAVDDVVGLGPVLDGKAPLDSPAFVGTPTGITKAHVGLGNVENTKVLVVTAGTAIPGGTPDGTAFVEYTP